MCRGCVSRVHLFLLRDGGGEIRYGNLVSLGISVRAVRYSQVGPDMEKIRVRRQTTLVTIDGELPSEPVLAGWSVRACFRFHPDFRSSRLFEGLSS